MSNLQPVDKVEPFGVWAVNNQLFYSKRNALINASNNGCPEVTWHWHDDVWKNFNIEKLGKRSLTALYRERAQHLRDSYDYLILSYSGGADSHNILMSFLDNNIKLDQIFVQQPFMYLDSSKHKPNTTDKTARNLVSEWDYCIKPTLEYLAQHHPEIKIEVSDWSKRITKSYYNEDTFLNARGSNHGAGTMARNLNNSTMALNEFDKGKKVASIYGFDKPMLALGKDKKRVHMYFGDTTMTLASNYVGSFEPFYWTPSLPELPFEMAFQVFLYYKLNPNLQELLLQHDMKHTHDVVNSMLREVTLKVCYSDTWDFRKFQADKPFSVGSRTDRDFFIYEYSNFEKPVNIWEYHLTDFYKEINKKYLATDNFMKQIRTNYYYIGSF
jgi:hypothetical protein